ncbi:hypothetical protein [Halorussus caseinilyticus]|uniref:hypothetical protein n=1 Tax=Halorussus caseinilyticus TaxID=3034025 RepID=UPI0023E7601A|nr:hypothetical protein [Halorussus sp. DT72]
MAVDFEEWLDSVFFAGLEISVLSIPALVALLYATPRGPVSLAALTAIAVSTCAAATLRGGWVELGDWPRPGDPYTVPARSAYYSATIAVASYLGAAAHVALGVPAAGIAVSTGVSLAAMVALPRAIGGFRSLANRLRSETF